jgi:tetratricopeptide (TPR) repeat protein
MWWLPVDRARFAKASQQALARRDYRELQSLCRAMRRADPAVADAWFLESVAAEAGRDMRAALTLVTEAVVLAPDNAEYWTQKARYHAQVNQVGHAMAAAQRALALGVSSPSQLDTLGVVLTRAGDYEAAARALRLAIAGRPDNPQYQFNLAAAEQFLGNDAVATAHYERVIAMHPAHARSYWALSEIEKNAVSARHEGAMRTLGASAKLDDRDALYLAHALARIDESRGDFAAAIQRLTDAKGRRRARFKYDFADDRGLFRSIRSVFETPDDVLCRAEGEGGTDDAAPLFIVGMPRSGTTLIERIVSAHSSVATLGELQELPLALKALSGVAGSQVLSADVVQALSTGAPPLASAYSEALRPRLGMLNAAQNGTPAYIIDKMPLNFLYLGFIFRLMPRARVILMRRDPMDVGLSNFRQLFAMDYSYYNYSYDLGDTGRYLAEFEHLCSHWQALLGDRLHCLHYEELVADPEPAVRGLLSYLELPWEQGCLDFHRSGAPVATPSASQVRQPLYSNAVGRWRRYGDALKPLQDALVAEGVPVTQAS